MRLLYPVPKNYICCIFTPPLYGFSMVTIDCDFNIVVLCVFHTLAINWKLVLCFTLPLCCFSTVSIHWDSNPIVSCDFSTITINCNFKAIVLYSLKTAFLRSYLIETSSPLFYAAPIRFFYNRNQLKLQATVLRGLNTAFINHNRLQFLRPLLYTTSILIFYAHNRL